jgi:hypothetical protein
MDSWSGNSDRNAKDGMVNEMVSGSIPADGDESIGTSMRIRPVIDAVSNLTAPHVEMDVTATDARRGRRHECQAQQNNNLLSQYELYMKI